MSRRRNRPLSKRLLFSLAAVAILMVIMEAAAWGVARLAGIEQGWLPFDNRPLDYSVSPLKIRGRPDDLPPSGFRIVCLGDSFTFGHGVAADDAYPAQLERALRTAVPDVPIEVLNAGQRGFNAVAEAHYITRRIDALAPSLLLWQFFRNDVEPNSHYFTLTMPWYMREPPAPLTYSNIYHLFFRRVLLPRWTAQSEFELRGFYEPSSRAWRDTLEAMAWIREETLRREIPVLFFTLPVVEIEQPCFIAEENQVLDAARQAGFETFNLRPVLWPPPPELYDYLVSADDHHPNAAGHALAAQAIITAMKLPERIRGFAQTAVETTPE